MFATKPTLLSCMLPFLIACSTANSDGRPDGATQATPETERGNSGSLEGAGGDRDSAASVGDAKDAAADSRSQLGTVTCNAAGCTTGFTCTACASSLVCDDRGGVATCVTVEAFFGCGQDTVFCQSSCGVCLPPGSACGLGACDANAKPCGSGASCGAGTKCVDDVCTLDK